MHTIQTPPENFRNIQKHSDIFRKIQKIQTLENIHQRHAYHSKPIRDMHTATPIAYSGIAGPLTLLGTESSDGHYSATTKAAVHLPFLAPPRMSKRKA